MTVQEELKIATEGLEQIQQAWRDGEYDHSYFQYERDNRTAQLAVDKLQKKLEAK